MMDMHPLVLGYLDDVCRQVKARELRKEIKQELASHLDELMELKREQGHDDNAAARWAIAQMGDTASVAQGLNQVHKPRIPWAMLGCLVLLITIALVTMYAVQLSYAADQRKIMTGIDLFLRQAVYMVAGLVVLFALSRFHYRRLLNFSWTLYSGTVALLLSVFMWGPRTNGISYLRLGPITMDVVGVSPYLLIVAAAGLLYRQKESTWKVLLHAVLFSVIPMLLYAIVPSVSELAIYAFAYALLLYASGCGWRWLIPHAFVFALILAMITLFSRFGRERFAAFFHRHEVPMDAGYMYIQIDEAVRSAGWWGHGFASVTQRLPYIHSDIIFTYIVSLALH
jgi:cell division protein FtsW (lipid II flippase)